MHPNLIRPPSCQMSWRWPRKPPARFFVAYSQRSLSTASGWRDKENPMPKSRCRVMWITRLCARCILFSFGNGACNFSRYFNLWIKRKGRPAPREVAPIIVSNHVSYIEPIFYFFELFATIVASESHDSIPYVGTIIRAMQVIYVNRFVPSSRRQVIREIKVLIWVSSI
ncbi:lysophospholipid acyltransferase LPEAT2-like [Cajanus cajan]|uniref:lysophospholipid acyltransferase LPEAT2-like n=1 Tax=Cajanus cajan TaxID=3821 RepID=UPI00098DAA77|nr:lysophospholipid acyltransferase LPEAT2-like [Cajanus cajan]